MHTAEPITIDLQGVQGDFDNSGVIDAEQLGR